MRLPRPACALAWSLVAALASMPFARAASLVALSTAAPASGATPGPMPGITPVIVESRLGGQIFGFDIDPDGNEGILSEAQTQNDGSVLAAVETFDQRTGEIIDIVTQRTSDDDFVTLGVVGHHVALVEYEHEVAFLDVERTFPMLDPRHGESFHRALESADRRPSPDRGGQPQPGLGHVRRIRLRQQRELPSRRYSARTSATARSAR